ncbi:oligoendopeptidase F [Mariniblastus fucicola]|uniref:Oligopeptidase F n=1 Tax=Mariniblastus fucicola TaxID=980251 RepID=A0A5B9PG08_9BACT|nr:oligoendopeptidase F [Mariniblastus fucicola]QEG24519.1 Oligoendopeptidase F, plasmid [Mariniblastus fucicola]
MNTVVRLPERSEVDINDTWDLGSLFPNDEAWETALEKFKSMTPGYEEFRGKLGESAQMLADCLDFDSKINRIGERVAYYAMLKTSEDQANSHYQGMMMRFQNIAVRAGEAASFMRPEILAIEDEKLESFLAEDCLSLYKLSLERLTRYKKYTLGEKEEHLLAMQGEMAGAAGRIFRQLNDSDLKFGTLKDANGEESELTNSSFSQFLISPDREVRKKAFHQYYEQFAAHENSLAAMLQGSIQKDCYYARARGYDSALHSELYGDNVPQSVYDSLVESVRSNLPALYKFYDLRKRKMGLDEIHHYDTYVPILSDIEVEHSWDEAVEAVCESLAPLGEEYVSTLRGGLSGRWCDRYPNKGKQSGAFSAGSFDGDPYILMNFKPKVLNDVFTLTHEAGHSMHSWYSKNNQPFEYYNYTIFVAEVASTFNEQLLTQHMLKNAKDDRFRAYLLNNEIDSIRATIIRQTMFAEFEKKTHEMCEAGEPLTVDAFKEVYGGLLKDYFGPDFAIDKELELECFRIPHFYRAFYVYQYATGLSAAIALSQRVLNGGEQELSDYLGFLKGGCSQYPLDLLRDAGVDLEKPEPVDTALKHFGSLVEELDSLL